MGIDVYMFWKDQDPNFNYSAKVGTRGKVGYLREPYHEAPYATRVLVPEGFGGNSGYCQTHEGVKLVAASNTLSPAGTFHQRARLARWPRASLYFVATFTPLRPFASIPFCTTPLRFASSRIVASTAAAERPFRQRGCHANHRKGARHDRGASNVVCSRGASRHSFPRRAGQVLRRQGSMN
jgi:hypothetical protein